METNQLSKRHQLAQQTYNEVIEKLKEHRKCILIRPTGFGKTYLLAHLTKKFKRVLYLYPLDIIRLDVKTKYANIVNKDTKFMSYKKLVSLHKAEAGNMITLVNKFDLIICDEAHMAGAEMTREAIKDLMDAGIEKYFIGATATIDRSDGYNVTDELFNNITISEYTLHDAIEEGLIPKPYYVYSLYKAAGSLKELAVQVEQIKDENKKKTLLNQIKSIEVEMANIINAPKVIKETVNTIYPDGLNYMKFIVFFSEKEILSIKKGEVQQWFREAYPYMNIRNLVITSDAEYAKNIHKLDDMQNEDNTIDLIYCIDMLNMGYHIENLTGIVMLRGTYSNIIYKQQIGRCLSVASSKTPIIFDFVNNILRKPYFGKYNITNKEGDTKKGSKLNDLTIRDLVMNDRTASYNEFIDKVVYEVERIKIEEAVYLYVDRSMPMKVLVKQSGLKEEYIRSEFTRRGIVMED